MSRILHEMIPQKNYVGLHCSSIITSFILHMCHAVKPPFSELLTCGQSMSTNTFEEIHVWSCILRVQQQVDQYNIYIERMNFSRQGYTLGDTYFTSVFQQQSFFLHDSSSLQASYLIFMDWFHFTALSSVDGMADPSDEALRQILASCQVQDTFSDAILEQGWTVDHFAMMDFEMISWKC